MKHRDHTHETVAEARACEANLNGTAAPAADTARTEINARLLRQHTNSAIMANLTGMEYRPQTPQAAKRDDQKFAAKNRGTGKATREITRAVASSTRDAAAWATRPAHPNRVTFAEKLIGERDTEYLTIEAGDVMMNVMDAKPVSADEIALLIDQLLKAPRKGAVAAPQQQAAQPAGWAEWREIAAELVATSSHPSGARFAVASGGANDLAFWWISKSGNGKFYLRQIIGGQEPRSEYRLTAMLTVAQKIKEAGAREAMIRFGQEIGRCGHCGRHLTDQDSRAQGIGPVCITK